MLLFSDSFDDRPTANIVQGWTQIRPFSGSNPEISTGQGRRGTNAYYAFRNFPGNLGDLAVTLAPGDNRAIVGFAFNSATAFSQPTMNNDDTSMFRLRHNGVTQCWAMVGSDGKLRVYQGSGLTLRYTSTSVLTQGSYAYLEFDITVHGSAGSIAIYVNGILDGTGIVSGINTGTANAWSEYTMARMDAPNGTTWYFDDLYILDGTGSRLNAPLGDTRVDLTLPNAAGNSSQWTRSAGADQWATIDDPQANGDTDYNTSSTTGHVDTLNFPPLPVAGAIVHAVVVKVQARKFDVGAAQLAGVTRVAGADYVSAPQSPGTTYNVARFQFPLNPATSAPWTVADYDAAEFGYKKYL